MDRSADDRRPRPAGRVSRLVVALCLVQFVDVLGVTELVTALPAVLHGLHASRSAGSVVLTAYAMCFAGTLMLGARLADRYGPREILRLGLATFFAGSLVCAAAPSAPLLVVGRGVQGIAAAISVPSTLRLLNAGTPSGAVRDRALALWSATAAVAGASGYIVGGVLTQALGWRAMFWVNLPAAVVLAMIVARVRTAVPADRARTLDVGGAACFTLAVMAIVIASGLVQPPRQLVLALVALTIAALAAVGLTAVERRATHPLFPRALLMADRVRIGARAAFVNTATTSSAIALATLDLQQTRHVAPAQAGLQLLPFSLGAVAGSRLAPRLLARASRMRTIRAGLLCIAASDLLLALTGDARWAITVGVAGAGLGIGLSSVAATVLGTDTEAEHQAGAAGIVNTAAQLGTALGVATVLLVTSLASADKPWPGWALAAITAALGAGTLGTRRAPTRR